MPLKFFTLNPNTYILDPTIYRQVKLSNDIYKYISTVFKNRSEKKSFLHYTYIKKKTKFMVTIKVERCKAQEIGD